MVVCDSLRFFLPRLFCGASAHAVAAGDHYQLGPISVSDGNTYDVMIRVSIFPSLLFSSFLLSFFF